MQKEKIEIKGAILDRPILWGKLQLFPENGSVWAAGMNHTEDRWIQRQPARFLAESPDSV